jgi:hypothetical protein
MWNTHNYRVILQSGIDATVPTWLLMKVSLLKSTLVRGCRHSTILGPSDIKGKL